MNSHIIITADLGVPLSTGPSTILFDVCFLWFLFYITLNCYIINVLITYSHVQGGPKKVSHYQESSLNRIKNRQPG